MYPNKEPPISQAFPSPNWGESQQEPSVVIGWSKYVPVPWFQELYIGNISKTESSTIPWAVAIKDFKSASQIPVTLLFNTSLNSVVSKFISERATEGEVLTAKFKFETWFIGSIPVFIVGYIEYRDVSL